MAIGPPRADRFAKRRGMTPRAVSEWQTTMPLRVELKPFERIIIGESVIINSDAVPLF